MSASSWDLLRQCRLSWLPELGIGYYPVTAQPYGADYWQRYQGYDRTQVGAALTAMRCQLVADYWGGDVVDIGIGAGRFVSDRPKTRGFDVNPYAVDWLKTNGAWCDPYAEQVDVLTFWDSLEHIEEPRHLLANVRRFVFVSCPIYEGPSHVLRSKHMRRDEHFWYWTHDGFVRFMNAFDFQLVHHDQREQAAGREDIGSYVFKSRRPYLAE